MKREMPLMVVVAAIVAACAGGTGRYAPEALRAAEDSITGERFLEHVRVLASEKF